VFILPILSAHHKTGYAVQLARADDLKLLSAGIDYSLEAKPFVGEKVSAKDITEKDIAGLALFAGSACNVVALAARSVRTARFQSPCSTCCYRATR
jgi:hypothetical protein